MATGQLYKTPANIEKFIQMIVLGCNQQDIIKEIGFARSTYYDWFTDKDILAEVDKRRTEIKDEGMRFIKARYKNYLENIDKLCNDTTDRRTCLAANQFMIEKMDGKNTSRLEVTDNKEETEPQDILENIEAFINEDDENINLKLVK